ncbi:hypothetical protein CAPTEDRAFT_209784 [Capitella teleta]|uniref:Uncharacterized protein n=1 Tax=Capitella teleta TaxID=283909 RepID=R7T3Z6_CAPTE|nr:hypothetical protein CAPTEDRAFT_209784 [Capitella teleta]|eukprot:ELT87582.1 hypothetical protein CAPTEDRAFT_209784 [Capitella teleta]
MLRRPELDTWIFFIPCARHSNSCPRDNYLAELLLGFSLCQSDILRCLAQHGRILSDRHLRRILTKKKLGRKKFSDIDDVTSFVNNELKGSGQQHGYRFMWQKLKDNGLNAQKDDVRLIIWCLDPEGVVFSYRLEVKASDAPALLNGDFWPEEDMDAIATHMRDVNFTGVSGIDPDELLIGRPYGGCAICAKSSVKCKCACVDYTNSNDVTGSRSTIDHFFVTNKVFSNIVRCSPLHEGDNLSEHSIIELVLSVKVPRLSEHTSGSRSSTEQDDIRDLFCEKYKELYNCVAYDESEMEDLLSELNIRVSNCCENGKCYDDHNVSVNQVGDAIKKTESKQVRPGVLNEEYPWSDIIM